jgi:hypothetical protein
MTLSWTRVESVLYVVLFVTCLYYVYVSWLAPVYDYLGFTLSPGDHPVLWLSLAIVLVSACMMPLRLDTFSDYFLWMVFYFVYVPSMTFVPLQGTLADDGFGLVSALGASFNITRFLARYSVRLPSVRVSQNALIGAFACVYIALTAYTVSVYGANLRIANLESVYAQRALSGELAAGSLVGYATGFLSGAFNPLLLAYGLVRRRPIWFFIGAAGQLFVYSTSALKSVALTVVLLPIFYFFLLRRRDITATRFGLLILGSCLVPLLALLLLNLADEGLAVQLVALVYMRTYGLAGALTGVYADFFATHPHTAFSHISIVSSFVAYPYEQSLGQEVGYWLVGWPLDANANFWATDGIASAGNIGVVLVGVIVGLFLIVANAAVDKVDRRLAFTALIPFIMMACNTSIFTSMLTGGGGLMLMMIYLWQSQSPQSGNGAS